MLSVELRGGRAKCPYDPDSNYTIIYVGEYTPLSTFVSRCIEFNISKKNNSVSLIKKQMVTSLKRCKMLIQLYLYRSLIEVVYAMLTGRGQVSHAC